MPPIPLTSPRRILDVGTGRVGRRATDAALGVDWWSQEWQFSALTSPLSARLGGAIYGNHVENCGNLWKSVEIYGNLWKSFGIHLAMAQNYQPLKWMVFLLNMIISVGDLVP